MFTLIDHTLKRQNIIEIKLLSFDAAEALKNNDAIRSKFADLFGL